MLEFSVIKSHQPNLMPFSSGVCLRAGQLDTLFTMWRCPIAVYGDGLSSVVVNRFTVRPGQYAAIKDTGKCD